MEDSSVWDRLHPVFAEDGYCVITMDLPCHGKSRFNGEICEMTEMAEAVFAILYKFKFFNPIVIGHSMGGYVGLELMKLMACRLILLHSNFWEDPPEKKNDRNRVIDLVQTNKSLFVKEAIPALFAEQNKEKCKVAIQRLIAKAIEIPSEEIAAATAGMRDRIYHGALVEAGNVQFIQGDQDPIIPQQKLTEELNKLNCTSTVVTIENCGHMSIWENEEALIASIKQLLIE